MRILQFDGSTIQREYAVKIDMVISSNDECTDVNQFFQKAIDYLDEDIYPGYNVRGDFSKASLISGEYRDIVQHWISAIIPELHFGIDDICNIKRIKHCPPDPCCEEFIVSTKSEYIMFMVYITE